MEKLEKKCWVVEDMLGGVVPGRVFMKVSDMGRGLGVSEQTLRNAFGRGVKTWLSGDGRWLVRESVVVVYKRDKKQSR